ncbi:MAG: hypothetical protein ONB30_04970 [candidate division KSB1 bacterium]|nr:hypothetical protein [candidate division KSB1 bacterium]
MELAEPPWFFQRFDCKFERGGLLLCGSAVHAVVRLSDYESLITVGGATMFGKRLGACLVGGVVCAALCTVGAHIIYGFPGFTWEDAAATVANRLLLGFVIGISSWRLNHLPHGAALGLFLSLSVSIGFLPNDWLGFLLFTSAGVLYGLLIEWFATDILKAPMRLV